MSLSRAQLRKHFLFGVKTWDLMTIVGATLLMITVGAIAAYLPARGASRIEPMEALRTE
jgi:ABC-type antimicrobial peptide transport system permease subunit